MGKKNPQVDRDAVSMFVHMNYAALRTAFPRGRVARWRAKGFIPEDAWRQIVLLGIAAFSDLSTMHGRSTPTERTLTLVLARFGPTGFLRLAHHLGVTPRLLRVWRTRGFVPDHQRFEFRRAVEQQFGITIDGNLWREQHGKTAAGRGVRAGGDGRDGRRQRAVTAHRAD